MVLTIIFAALFAMATLLLIYASKENSNLEGEKNQNQQYATRMAMQIIKLQDAESIASNPEMMAALIIYSDKAHGAGLQEGRSLDELTEYLKARPYCRTEIAERLIKAATAHKFYNL